MKKILVANRGEIALRIMRTAKKMGIKTVAIYSAADRVSLHRKMADEAVFIGAAPAIDSYLDIDKIIAAAKETGADAIHPAYGFLSENACFTRACEEAGIIFIGPSIEAMAAMGDKSSAKNLMEKAGVPLAKGYQGQEQGVDFLKKEAEKIGLPLLIKAVAGGGGKGMKPVKNWSDFEESLASAKREATASFGDERVLLEKLIENPRHIEVQILADSFGNIVHLFDRDCSVQRRHQKVLEEAPAPNLPQKTRENMAKAAIAAARSIDYCGVGTIEFLLDSKGEFYFMEMNTRLQVEHPVTEMITGIDLVEWQIKVAAGEKLELKQGDISQKGNAIEVRLYAEDPENDYLPQTGWVNFDGYVSEKYYERVESGVDGRAYISQFYDPMIAKLVAWGKTRDEAIKRLIELNFSRPLVGISNNQGLLLAILHNQSFQIGGVDTGFLDVEKGNLLPQTGLPPSHILYDGDNLNSPWRMNLNEPKKYLFRADNGDEKELILEGKIDAGIKWFFDDGLCYKAEIIDPLAAGVAIMTDDGGGLIAPMPSAVTSILVEKGDNVEKGDILLILEAMKMEQPIRAPHDGKIEDIFYKKGEQVKEGDRLIELI